MRLGGGCDRGLPGAGAGPGGVLLVLLGGQGPFARLGGGRRVVFEVPVVLRGGGPVRLGVLARPLRLV